MMFEKATPYPSYEALDLEVIPLDDALGLNAPVNDRLNVFGGIGADYYLLDSDVDVDNEIGFIINDGLEFDMVENNAAYGETRAPLFVEAMYRSVSIDGDNSGADLDLDSLVINGGLMVRW